MNRPLLVAVFGNDGAGKSTLVRSLRELLESRQVQTAVFDKWDILNRAIHPNLAFLEPDLDQLRIAIARMTSTSRLLFLFWSFAASMREAVDADVVLFDGYWYKHAAAEVAMGASESLVDELSRAMPSPDLGFYLDVEPTLAAIRKGATFTPYECGCVEPCTFDNFLNHQTRVRAQLQTLSRRINAVQVDGALSPEDVLTSVAHHISETLNQRAAVLNSI